MTRGITLPPVPPYRLTACIARWRSTKPCVYFRIPQTTSHNRPGSTRMGELLAAALGSALDRLEPLLKLVEGTA
jgi:hypothetical protein